MTTKENIALLGCGWLGLPLAKSFIDKGYRVNGSTTTLEKMPQMTGSGITPFHLDLGLKSSQTNLKAFLEGTDVLVINIPTLTKTHSRSDFKAILDNLVQGLKSSGPRKLIFVSSTSRYRDAAGFPSYSENSEPFSGTEATARLQMAESVLKELESENFKTSVVRFGGLVGPERHPVFHLSGRRGIANPEGPINLIHQKDCTGILERILEKEAFGEDFNAVYPYHPSRRSYYTAKADELRLEPPVFEEGPSVGKIIESAKVGAVLEYRFQVRP